MSTTPARGIRLPTFSVDAQQLQHESRQALQRAVQSGAQQLERARLFSSEVGQAVESHAQARAYTSLSTTAFSILDLFSGANDDANDLAVLGQAEAESQRLAATAQAQNSGSAAAARDRTWGDWAHQQWDALAYRIRQRLTVFTAAPTTWLFLVALGALTAAVGALVEVSTGLAVAMRAHAVQQLPPVVNFLVWTLWCSLGAVVATGVCHLTNSPQAEGSGIPYLKSMMAGTPLTGVLSLKVLLVKLVGLIAAQGGGLTVGKEGPFVHMAGALAAQLWESRIFGSLSLNEGRRRQLLAAAVAAGVTAVFGTPIGGVLFSIEVTSTYTLVSSQWMCFVCAIVCRLFYDAFAGLRERYAEVEKDAGSHHAGAGAAGGLAEDYSFAVSIPTDFKPAQPWELTFLALLGIACGLLGSLFVVVVHKAKLSAKVLIKGPRSSRASTTARERQEGAHESYAEAGRAWLAKHWRRYALCASVAALVAASVYPTAFLSRSDMAVLKDLLLCPTGMRPHTDSTGAVTSPCPAGVWASTGAAAVASLATFLVIRFAAVVLSISLPLPCGMFQPLIILGAAAGRLAGEIVAGMTATEAGTVHGHGSAAVAAAHSVQPGLYAVVGAAALVSGATHTVSTAVILIELTGQAVHLVPVLLATLLAYTAAGAFTLPVYDVLMLASGMPYLPRVHSAATYAKTAGEVARKLDRAQVLVLRPGSTYADAVVVLKQLALSEQAHAATGAHPLAHGAHAAHDTAGPAALHVHAPDLQDAYAGFIAVVEDVEGMRIAGCVDRVALASLLVQALAEGGGAAQRRHTGGQGGGVQSAVYHEEEEDLERSGLLDVTRGEAAFSPVRVQTEVRTAEDEEGMHEESATASTPSRRTSENGRHPTPTGSPSDPPGASSSSSSHPSSVPSPGSGHPTPLPAWMHLPIAFKGRTSPLPHTASAGASGQGPLVQLDPAPMCLDVHTPLGRLHFLFALLLLPHVLVSDGGSLVGWIPKEDLCVPQ